VTLNEQAWAGSTANTYVAKAVLESMGCKVKITQIAEIPVYQALADGTYTVQATQADNAGNIGTSTAHTFTVDTAAPNAPSAPDLQAGSDNGTSQTDNITNDNTLTLTGTAAANSSVKVFDGTTQVGTVTANSSGVWTLTTGALADGSHSLTATATTPTDTTPEAGAPPGRATTATRTTTRNAPPAAGLPAGPASAPRARTDPGRRAAAVGCAGSRRWPPCWSS